jgi:hypothetical protein
VCGDVRGLALATSGMEVPQPCRCAVSRERVASGVAHLGLVVVGWRCRGDSEQCRVSAMQGEQQRRCGHSVDAPTPVAPRWLAAPVAAFPPFLPFFPLLPFSWSWREVVATMVVAERMKGARAPRVAPTYRGQQSWEGVQW